MITQPPRTQRFQRGMNLFEMMVFVLCLSIALGFSGYMASSHHWIVGAISFPLAFFSTMYIIALMGEIAVRCGYSHRQRTSTALIRRSLAGGTIFGAVIGLVFYCLGIIGIIPTIVSSPHRLFMSACLFGASVALTSAFGFTIRHGTKKPIAKP